MNLICALFLSYHTVHQNKFQFVFIKGLMAVLVIRCPDVTGDSCSDSCVCVSISRIGQQRAFIIQQSKKQQNTTKAMEIFRQSDLCCQWYLDTNETLKNALV